MWSKFKVVCIIQNKKVIIIIKKKWDGMKTKSIYLYRSSASSLLKLLFPAGWLGADPPCEACPGWSGNLKFPPKPRLCCNVCENMSYFLMSLSLTERLANFIASSKCPRVISGTRSSSSMPSMTSVPFSFISRSRFMSFSMHSRMANLHARWQISVISAPLKPCVVLAKNWMSTSLEIGDLRRAAKIDWKKSSYNNTLLLYIYIYVFCRWAVFGLEISTRIFNWNNLDVLSLFFSFF